MALDGIAAAAPPGVHGFDCADIVSADHATQFLAVGFGFCIRYLSRNDAQGPNDLSAEEEEEAAALLDAGLALMAVQHVAAPGWLPTQPLGTQNGRNAANNAESVGLPAGINIWLDLEGINHTANHADVIAYCNAWFDEVSGAGFVPGIYVGANCVLTGDELFWRLKTAHYWQSGSDVPAIPNRGYQYRHGFRGIQLLDSNRKKEARVRTPAAFRASHPTAPRLRRRLTLRQPLGASTQQIETLGGHGIDWLCGCTRRCPSR
jgi:Domain of unknown function (DUF1906)